MKIEKIILNNFRIYAGKNEVVFKAMEDKNISLIAGKNGFGKTSFLTALIWGMYGNTMEQVEEKYQRDIKNAGSYNAYSKKLLNNKVMHDYIEGQSNESSFYVQIELIDVLIPSIPCKKVVIKRTYNVSENKEDLSILIDGQENELTKDVGYDVFINDFILPREIAKFFFFDAEKIVSLAEAKSKTELKSLSKAYSEVLGIKKYEDLKVHLKTLLNKLKRNSVSKNDLVKLEGLEKTAQENSKLIRHTEQKLNELAESMASIKTKIDVLQEKLIREGNDMTLYELDALKRRKEEIKIELDRIKVELKSLIEYVPLVIASKSFKRLVVQVNKELRIKQNKIGRSELEEEYTRFQTLFSNELKNIIHEPLLIHEIGSYFDKIKEERLRELSNSGKDDILLDFDYETSRKIIATYDYLQNTFKPHFSKVLHDEKELKQESGRLQKKIREGEARKGNPLSVKLLEEKQELETGYKNLEAKQLKLIEELGGYKQKDASNSKVLSELLKTTKLQKIDSKKYDVTIDLLNKINELTNRIKEEKKYSLQKSLQLGLKKLMHKKDKIREVAVRIEDDLMDIDLIDEFGNVIDKEGLSKGEQQLYATALLKALVDESGIHFPVFIDSPLQKFDLVHSSNVIQQFYPSISGQVVLFPLLEKELSTDEYELLKPYLSDVYLITNDQKGSSFENCSFSELYNKFNQQHVLTH
jgi:DNA sulfur modification protein DndD